MNLNKARQMQSSHLPEDIDVTDLEFGDLFDLDEMQKLQDTFAEALGVASVMTKPDGTLLTRPSRFNTLCSEVIHKTTAGRNNCQMLSPDLKNLVPKKLSVRCEACRKWEIFTGISVGDRLLAIWRAGQIRDTETTDEQLLQYARQIGADIDEYKRHLAATPVMSEQQRNNVANFLFETAQLITRAALKNALIQRAQRSEEAEQKLKKNSLLSEKAFELSKAGYWSVLFDNPDYYLSNQRTASIFGDLPKPDWCYHIKNEWLANIEAADPDAAVKTYQCFLDVIEGRCQLYDVIYPYRRPIDGKVVWIHAVGELRKDKNLQPLEMYGVSQDVTAQITAEHALKESQEHLDLALKGAWLGLWDWQPDTGHLYTSDIWAEMLGYSAEELDALYPRSLQRWQKLIHPEDMTRIWQDVQDHLEGINPTYRTEFRLKTKPGKWKWILAIGKCVKRNSAGKGTRMIGFHIDIDEQKSNEESLAMAKANAEAAAAAKSTFLANMSHEIRTPMNAIIGMTQLALQTELTQQQRNYIEKVNISAQSLLGIINDILDFSKIEAGKMAIDEAEFHLEDVLNSFAIITSLKAEEKGLELIFDIAPDVPQSLMGDPVRLNQVLTNLGSNAIKFTDSGEIVVGIEQISATAGIAELHFWVRDSGPGIDQLEQEKLFVPFSQLDGSANRKSGGTGLGLTISKSLVEGMNGRIWINSQPGQGSCFHFTARFAMKRALHNEDPYLESLTGKSVLLLAQNTTERSALSRNLIITGARLESIENCQELHKKLEEYGAGCKPPDVIIASSDPSGTIGIECVIKVRNSALSEIPIILIASAYQLAQIMHSTEKLGINSTRVISRPVFPSALTSTILEALGLATGTGLIKAPEQFGIPSPQCLSGTRLLLVEDNEINQELAGDFLRQAGANVTIAVNGQQAIDILQDDPQFDAILMDCQMPVMDGYSATRIIRNMPAFKKIPIIAMTANAMVGDRDKVIAAGMNEHIAKPINVRNMFATILNWIEPKIQADTTISEPAQTASEVTIPELAGIDTKRALSNLLDNTELYHRMLTSFYDNYIDFSEKFMMELNRGDNAAVTRYAHSLKSSAGNIGATSIQLVAGELEQACKAGVNTADIFSLANKTAQEIKAVCVELKKHLRKGFEQDGVQQSPHYDRAKFVVVFDRLKEALVESDSEAVSIITRNKVILQAAMPETFDQLQTLIRSYDFESALELLEQQP